MKTWYNMTWQERMSDYIAENMETFILEWSIVQDEQMKGYDEESLRIMKQYGWTLDNPFSRHEFLFQCGAIAYRFYNNPSSLYVKKFEVWDRVSPLDDPTYIVVPFKEYMELLLQNYGLHMLKI